MKLQIMILIILLGSFQLVNISAEELFEHNYIGPGGSLSLLPDREETKSISAFYENNKPAYSVEMVFEFPSDESVDWKELYFRLRSISSLGEITYFSEHAGEYRKMFPRAYVIKSSSNKKHVPDYDVNTKFADAEIYAFLEEVVLGSGTYKINYRINDDSIKISLQNTTNLRRIIKIVNRDEFYMDFLFFEDGGHLKVYLFGAYTLKNEFIIRKVLKYPYSTLAKRVYTIFTALIGDFHGAELTADFPEYLREK